MERLYIGYRERIFNFWIYLVVCQELIDGFIRCHFDSSFFLRVLRAFVVRFLSVKIYLTDY